MALFNYATRELSAKIVYYGPGLSGKTTNIEKVHRILRPEQKGRLISLPTETDRTLFFDFLPVDLGQIKGFKVRYHLYTVPGQVFYNATRRLVLQGVDGVVFVADSQADMKQSNLESLKNLMENLATYGKRLEDLPFVLQYNKRDLRQILPVQQLNALLNPRNVPAIEGIAKDGVGVSETLVTISRMVFGNLRKTLLMPGEAAEHKEVGDFAETNIRQSLRAREAEPLEEISDLEEIEEVREGPLAEEVPVPLEAGDTVPDEIELEVPEPAPPPASAPAPPKTADYIPFKFELGVPEPAPPPASGPAPPEAADSVPDEIEIEIPEPAPPPRASEKPRAGISPPAVGSPEPPPASPAASGPAPPEAADSVPDEIEIEIPEPAARATAASAPPPVSAPAPPEPADAVPDEIEVEVPEPAPAASREDASPAATMPPAAEAPSAPRGAVSESGDEIEIRGPAPAPSPLRESRLGVSVETEAGDLTFLKFENPYVAPQGYAVLPAVFMDNRGNIVRLRIRIAMEERG